MFKKYAFIMLLFVTCVTHAQVKFEAGKDYLVIDKPVTTSDPSKVEVMEFFWYGCAYCNSFRPIFEAWKEKQDEHVDVKRMPAIWSKKTRIHASIYYTAVSLGKDEVMHKDIFDAIHQRKLKLETDDEIYTLFEKHGIERKAFDSTFKSFSTASKTKATEIKLNRDYRIKGTPELIVNGKYRIVVKLAGNQKNMLKIASYLVDKERQALSK